MVGETLTAWVGEWATVSIAQDILEKAASQLNKQDIEKALKVAVSAAEENCEALFWKCEPRYKTNFLNAFFQGIVIEELQKPLQQQEIPELELLEHKFKQDAQQDNHLKESIDYTVIGQWLKIFIDTYIKETDTYLRFQVAKQNYLRQLLIRFDKVEFAGMAVDRREEDNRATIKDIFIIQDVKEEKQAASYSFPAAELYSDRDDGHENILRQEQRLLRQTENILSSPFSAQKLLTNHPSRKGVLLGKPGTGKSTLLNYYVTTLAKQNPQELGLDGETDWLPIILVIRDLLLYKDSKIIDYYTQHFCEESMEVKTLPEDFFKYWLEDGRAVILIDGLDEIPEEGQRHKLIEKIDSFLGCYKNNTVLITSRPHGYQRSFFHTENLPHYWLQEFDDKQINLFIDKWYDTRLPNDRTTAARRKEELRKAIESNERIKLLTRNPLLLTIIALIHRYQAQLPRERYELYNSAVKTLLVTWDARREIEANKILKYLDTSDLRRLMESLAYWIHRQGSTEDGQGGTLIEQDELLDFLTKEIKALKNLELYQAKEKAECFLTFIQQRTGLLNEQGIERYAFVHKTFQEYLCAEEINYQADNEDDFQLVLDAINSHLHDAHWREVLLLLIAQQKPKKAAKAIRTILEANSKYEQWLYRDLFFAGSCLAENPKGLNREDGSLVQEILEKLVDLEVNDNQRIGGKVREQLSKVFCSLYETEFEVPALTLLKAEQDKIAEYRLQEYRTELGEKEAVIDELIQQLSDGDASVRWDAAFALGNLGNTSKKVIDAWLQALSDEHYEVRSQATEALGNSGNTSEKVIDALLQALLDSYDSVRENAVIALGNLGNTSEKVIDVLLNALLDSDDSVRENAVKALGNSGNTSEKVIDALLQALLDSYDSVRENAAIALAWLGNNSESVIDVLLQTSSDKNDSMCWYIAWALGRLGNTSEKVIAALLKAVSDEDVGLRWYAAEALGWLGNTSEKVIAALLQALSDRDDWLRKIAASALGNLSNTSEEVMTALLHALSDEEALVRLEAAEALGKLGNASEKVIAALLQALSDRDDLVRRKAAEALGKLDNTSEEVIAALLQALSDRNAPVRLSAALSLDKLGNTSEKVIAALLQALSDRDDLVRRKAAEALGKLGKQTDKITPLVVEWIQQHQETKFVGNGIDALWELVNLP